MNEANGFYIKFEKCNSNGDTALRQQSTDLFSNFLLFECLKKHLRNAPKTFRVKTSEAQLWSTTTRDGAVGGS